MIDDHDRTLLTWPPREEAAGTDVPGFRDEVEATARAIARFEPVTLVVDPRDTGEATRRFADAAAVEIVEIPVDCCWLRDNGPIFVRSAGGEDVAGVHFGFNGWGMNRVCRPRFDSTVSMNRLGQMTMSISRAPAATASWISSTRCAKGVNPAGKPAATAQTGTSEPSRARTASGTMVG